MTLPVPAAIHIHTSGSRVPGLIMYVQAHVCKPDQVLTYGSMHIGTLPPEKHAYTGLAMHRCTLQGGPWRFDGRQD